MNKKVLTVVLSAVFFFHPFFAQNAAVSAFLDGCKAYTSGDWTSAVFSLKKAAAFEENNNAETYYMLINAEIYSGDFQSALDSCIYFLEEFKGSFYESNVVYLKGRCFYSLGEYDKAVITLSDFCHQYEGHDMYPSSLFWIGEAFYACYQYDDARALYQRVVSEFPDDVKAPACQYRIETISQRDREEKLLYLLKQTGEEYLFAKEEYEKQLKLYSSDTNAGTRAKLYEAQRKNAELEEKYNALQREVDALKGGNKMPVSSGPTEAELELLRQLRIKAEETRYLLETKSQKNNQETVRIE
ncbi:MAG: tetratricopeptide repeat protein [Treponema sp.]|nr:tetratricopeptide repeat protein [Treponema sp.]